MRTLVMIARVACGYRVLVARPLVDYTEADLAWFRAPLREGR